MKKYKYADDDIVPVKRLVQMRIPSLMIGLVLGFVLSFATSGFEKVLEKDIKVAFFIPFIVYMASAVGSQTQNIYVRDLRTGKTNFKTYLFKESILGIILGLVSSLAVGTITYLWLQDYKLTLAVCLSMFTAIAVAPLLALIITKILQIEHSIPLVFRPHLHHHPGHNQCGHLRRHLHHGNSLIHTSLTTHAKIHPQKWFRRHHFGSPLSFAPHLLRQTRPACHDRKHRRT